MNSDAAFQIGTTHRICEDYAAAIHYEGRASVILADGCSSSPDTDIGARLLVKAAQNGLTGALEDWEVYARNAAAQAVGCARCLGLAPACLDATLLTLIADRETFEVSLFGDGVAVLGRRDGRLEAWAVSYAASYPRYPSYELDPARAVRWAAQNDNARQIEHWLIGPAGIEAHSVEPSDRVFEVWSGTCADYVWAALLSDGVQSFLEAVATETSRTSRPVLLPEVLPRLLAFKCFTGAFVQRRMQAFAKECRTRGWSHRDDLSLAAVWLGE